MQNHCTYRRRGLLTLCWNTSTTDRKYIPACRPVEHFSDGRIIPVRPMFLDKKINTNKTTLLIGDNQAFLVFWLCGRSLMGPFILTKGQAYDESENGQRPEEALSAGSGHRQLLIYRVLFFMYSRIRGSSNGRFAIIMAQRRTDADDGGLENDKIDKRTIRCGSRHKDERGGRGRERTQRDVTVGTNTVRPYCAPMQLRTFDDRIGKKKKKKYATKTNIIADAIGGAQKY